MSCTLCEIDEIKCDFAEVMFNKFKELKFGIATCCTEDFNKMEIKLKLAEFSLIQDSDTQFVLNNQTISIFPVSFGDCCK
jgi:hypothetical protein